MSEETKACPKCDGSMEQGFVPDYSYMTTLVASWHAGPPQKSFLGNARAPVGAGIPIGALRCGKCGFLEFYANSGPGVG